MYEDSFRVADEGYFNGRVAATRKNRETHWNNWCSYVSSLGVDPELQDEPFLLRQRTLSGFAGLSRTGHYGKGKQVQTGTVSSAITAIGQKITLVCGINPTKMVGSDKMLPRLSEMYQGWAKEDPATSKKMPVEVDVPERMCEKGRHTSATELMKAVGDLALIAFYYLLRVGEYTVKKGKKSSDKQTIQFRLKDITFFKKNRDGQLRQLNRRDRAGIMTADSATLKLDNSKNGWKGVCIHQEENGEEWNCAIRALGRRYCYILQQSGSLDTFLSAFWIDGTRYDVCDEDIRKSIKLASVELDYLCTRGIPEELVDTHSLRAGGANALALAGYSDTQIQKMG